MRPTVNISFGAHVYSKTDLTQIPRLHGVYKLGLYEQQKAEIDPEDDQVLILHYQGRTNPDIVVDFGLPVTVAAADASVP